MLTPYKIMICYPDGKSEIYRNVTKVIIKCDGDYSGNYVIIKFNSIQEDTNSLYKYIKIKPKTVRMLK